MFFSIVIPVYNVEKYLEECVESILGQRFTDYEIVLVNDGSKDSSGDICDRYSNQYGFIKTIHKANGGQADARNVGTAAASGKYIVYIDSDDYILNDTFLSDIYDHVTNNDSEIVMYKFSKFYDDSKIMEKCTFSFPDTSKYSGDALLLEMVKKDAYYGMAWTKAFKRSLSAEFDKNLVCEDMDWFFNLLLNATSFSVIDKEYIAYRQRSNSVTSNLKIKNLTDFIYTLEKWSKIITESNMAETKKKALNGALAKYYANLLIVYARLDDKEKRKCVSRIKKLSFLLDFSINNRPAQIRKVYKIAGFSAVIAMLTIVDRLKGIKNGK